MELQINFEKITSLFKRARDEDRYFLFEHETYNLLSYSGSETPPKTLFINKNNIPAKKDLSSIPGDKIVMKIVSPSIVHKTEVEGVRIVKKNRRRSHII